MDKAVNIVGVPMDLGQSRRGVDMGPSALRYAGLDNHLRQVGCQVRDSGNVEIQVRDELPAEGGLTTLDYTHPRGPQRFYRVVVKQPLKP